MSYFGQQYPLYYPQSISGYERVKMITMTQTTMTEMEQRTKQLVIFGATGDLCKKKLIPALYKLWERGLLQENLLVTGTARREPTVTQWKESLGEYPEEFLHHLDYQPSDLTKGETLQCLPQAEDVTYFYLYPQRDMKMLSSISKKQDSSITPKHPVWLLRNPWARL